MTRERGRAGRGLNDCKTFPLQEIHEPSQNCRVVFHDQDPLFHAGASPLPAAGRRTTKLVPPPSRGAHVMSPS